MLWLKGMVYMHAESKQCIITEPMVCLCKNVLLSSTYNERSTGEFDRYERATNTCMCTIKFYLPNFGSCIHQKYNY